MSEISFTDEQEYAPKPRLRTEKVVKKAYINLTLWDKIKALEQEYERLSDKAYEIEQDKKAISFLIQKYLTHLK